MDGRHILRLVAAAAMTLFLTIGLVMCGNDKAQRRDATLIVNGKTVEHAEAYIHGEYPMIPLIETFAACGYEIEWTASDVARMMIDGVAYIVNVSEPSMTAEGEADNLLLPAPGSIDSVCEVSGKDILIYCYRLRTNLHAFTDIQFEYTTDVENSVIYVDIGVLAEMSD